MEHGKLGISCHIRQSSHSARHSQPTRKKSCFIDSLAIIKSSTSQIHFALLSLGAVLLNEKFNASAILSHLIKTVCHHNTVYKDAKNSSPEVLFPAHPFVPNAETISLLERVYQLLKKPLHI